VVVEQHNALLMRNHEARPSGAAPLPEANVVEARDQSEVKRDDHRGYNNVWGRGKDKRRYNNRRGSDHNKRENNMSSQNNPSKSNCHRCGMKGHWKNECRTLEHFVRLYQNSFKRKGNKGGASSSNDRVESHLTLKDDDKPRTSQKYMIRMLKQIWLELMMFLMALVILLIWKLITSLEIETDV